MIFPNENLASLVNCPPFSEWPIEWDYYYMGIGSRHVGSPQAIPNRRCPHGGFFFDEKILPPFAQNAWIVGGEYNKHCDSPVCRREVRKAKHGR